MLRRLATFITGSPLRALLFLFVFSLSASAQRLTDTQIVDYVKQRNAAGANMTTIATELLEKGATKDQLLRVKRAYEAQDATNPATTNATAHPGTVTSFPTSTASTPIDRSRSNNGEAPLFDDADSPLGLNPESDADGPLSLGAEKRIFGHDIFRSRMLSFEPNMAIAVPTTYVLGPGDEVIVDVFGDSQRSDKHKIAPDGTVTLAYAGPVGLSGKTLAQAQATISSSLSPYYAGSNIKVSVGQTRSITVNVMGEVQTPGSYTLSAFANVFHALYSAGGINDIGTLRNIKVCRGGRVVSTVDVYDYILSGNLSGNVILREGDVILVDTYQNLVEISGYVKRPMFYEMKSGESLRTLLDYAGGFRGDAFTETVRVNRTRGAEQYVYTPSFDDFANFPLLDADVVYVSNSETRLTNVAEIKGAVFRPGQYEIGDEAQTVRSLITLAGGLREDALRSRAVLLRMKADRSQEAIALDIDGILTGSTPDVALCNEDILTISSRAREISQRVLNIDGEVYEPGEYNYADNLTVEDLIIMAGGLKESASLLNVEVSRRIVNPEGHDDSEQRAEIFNVTLNGSLTLDGTEGFRLQPYDEVYVRKSPEYSEQRAVWIRGEVLFEGRYVLENQNERLSDIIKRTGGFTSKASIRDARLRRQMNETELLRRARLIEKANAANADSVSLERLDLNETYYVGIDLDAAINTPGGSADLVLRDGDELVIPQYENTVKINGEVLYPNTVTYLDGQSLSYYINQAGGYTKEAQRKSAYIIYNNGHVSRASKGKILPGCEIVVPTKKHRENTHTLATSLSITTAIATIAAVLVSALK